MTTPTAASRRTALREGSARRLAQRISTTPVGTISWPIWIVAWFVTGRPGNIAASPAMLAAVYVGSFAPGAAALLMSTTLPGARQGWLRTFVQFHCGWRPYAAALLPLPLVLLLLTVVLGYSPRVDRGHGLPAYAFYLTIFPVSIFNGFMNVITGAGPLGEEGGWRGYLLPRLLKTFGAAQSSLVIGVIWALWHLPIMAMFADWRGGVSFEVYLPLYAVGVIGLSFIMSSIWLIGRGSLVPCIWFHGLVNAVGSVAFDPSLWTSRWSAGTSTAHFAVATLIVSVLLYSFSRRWRYTRASPSVA